MQRPISGFTSPTPQPSDRTAGSHDPQDKKARHGEDQANPSDYRFPHYTHGRAAREPRRYCDHGPLQVKLPCQYDPGLSPADGKSRRRLPAGRAALRIEPARRRTWIGGDSRARDDDSIPHTTPTVDPAEAALYSDCTASFAPETDGYFRLRSPCSRRFWRNSFAPGNRHFSSGPFIGRTPRARQFYPTSCGLPAQAFLWVAWVAGTVGSVP